jgi:hypothetical protein
MTNFIHLYFYSDQELQKLMYGTLKCRYSYLLTIYKLGKFVNWAAVLT